MSLKPSGLPDISRRPHLLNRKTELTLRRRSAVRAPEDPGSAHSAAPRALRRGVFPATLHHSEHTSRNLRFRSAPVLHRSGSATGGRCQTSTRAVPLYRHWLPCPLDPAWLPHHARDYKARQPALDRPGLRDDPTTCLGKLWFASYPLLLIL